MPEQVAERLAGGGFDAVTFVHNETSTGVTSPVKEIAEAVRSAPNGNEIMILIDSVSGLSGARIEFDAWDLDVVLSSSQKAFALPPGLAFCAVSDRAMAKAQTVPKRGYRSVKPVVHELKANLGSEGRFGSPFGANCEPSSRPVDRLRDSENGRSLSLGVRSGWS